MRKSIRPAKFGRMKQTDEFSEFPLISPTRISRGHSRGVKSESKGPVAETPQGVGGRDGSGSGEGRRPVSGGGADFPQETSEGAVPCMPYGRGTRVRRPVDAGNDPAEAPPAATPPRLLDRLRGAIRVRHYSIRTESAYVDWARRFILFHGKRHPLSMGAAEVDAFLSHLAVDRQVAPATQS